MKILSMVACSIAAVVTLLLPGCVKVSTADLPGVRLFIGSPVWPFASGVYRSDTGGQATVKQTISRGGDRVYAVERDGKIQFFAVYPRETRDWYILEQLGDDGSIFVFVKVFDGQAVAVFNDDAKRCQNYAAASYLELIAAMNKRYFECPDVSELWTLSGG